MSRAGRRRSERTKTVPPDRSDRDAPRATSDGTSTALLGRAAFFVVTGLLLIAVARMVEARITWYLAVDQFGYLHFANDLLHGTVFHDYPPLQALGNLMPPRADALAQTYVWDHGRLTSRYAPGFPILVALWLAVFGPLRIVLLNPTIFLLFLVVLLCVTRRLTGSAWRGLIAVALIVLTGHESKVYWWSLTLTRDLSAHLFALTGLLLLLPARRSSLGLRRTLPAAICLGYAGSIRNDAVLYLIPASLVVLAQWRRTRPAAAMLRQALAGAAAGLVLGLLPTLALNTITSGNPLWPTQGMELQEFFQGDQSGVGVRRMGFPPPARFPGWQGGTHTLVQGGGLRLKHLPTTLPANWNLLVGSYGPVLIGLAFAGAAVALYTRPLLFLFAVPYAVTAFLFFSCWSRSDYRYQIGVFTMLALLASEGIVGPIEAIRRRALDAGDQQARAAAMGLAVLGFLVALWASPIASAPPATLQNAPQAQLGWMIPLAIAIAASVASRTPRALLAPAFGAIVAVLLSAYGMHRADGIRQNRAGFQQPEMQRAQATVRRAIDPRSVVITTERIGRPAENLEYYGGVYALYLTDLVRWKLQVWAASAAFIKGGLRPYLLIDDADPELPGIMDEFKLVGFVAQKVAAIPPQRNMDYFVAAPFHRGLPLSLYRISLPVFEDRAAKDTGEGK